MGYVLTAAFVAFVGVIWMFGTWAGDATVDPAARHVLATATYSLGGAAAINTLCTVLAAKYRLVEPAGSESEACIPYSIVAVPVIARVHIFNTGGYVNGEWSYVWNTPSRTSRYVEEAVCKALGRC